MVVGPSSRGLRYGDGLFETMKVRDGTIQLKELHFQRLFTSLAVLKFILPPHFTPGMLEEQILILCKKNHFISSVRIRLLILRSNGGLFDPENHTPNFLIESIPLEQLFELNSNGLVVDICPGIQKSCDSLSNLKSNNFLPYVMAALWAKEQKLNDAIVLNTFGRICDSTIANIFIISGGRLVTPPLSEGCVAGVMRQWLINKLPSLGFGVDERPITISQLHAADEVFFTNVIKGIRWVKRTGSSAFTNKVIKQIYYSLPESF